MAPMDLQRRPKPTVPAQHAQTTTPVTRHIRYLKHNPIVSFSILTVLS
jgi:hypothetical protein